MNSKEANVWNVKSIYEFYFFNCPSCPYRNECKEDFVNHSYTSHPESVNYLKKISDGSLNDITYPWESFGEDNGQLESYEDELLENKNEIYESIDIKVEDPLKDESEIKVESFNSYDNFQESNENSKMEADDTVVKNETTAHKCDTCGQSFGQKGHLKRHMDIVHLKLKPHKCEECGETFGRKEYLKAHMDTVHLKLKSQEQMKKEIKCGSCEKTFYTKQQLQSHGCNAHGTNKVKPKCEICGKYANNLQLHKRNVHEGRRNYNCELCSKSFSTDRYLKTHLAMHNGKEEFKCSLCEKSFFKENELDKHNFTVHEGHTDNKCGICLNGYKFKNYNRLKNHVYNVHENADRKDHLCGLCGKSFKHSKSLGEHILSVSCLKYLLNIHTYYNLSNYLLLITNYTILGT